MMASRTPFPFSPDRWRKKLTVIGMIGQTHGVKSAMIPPRSPMRNMYHSDLPSVSG